MAASSLDEDHGKGRVVAAGASDDVGRVIGQVDGASPGHVTPAVEPVGEAVFARNTAYSVDTEGIVLTDCNAVLPADHGK